MDNLGDIGDFIEDAVDTAGSFSFLAIFIVLAALILAAVAAAAALIDAILGALTTLSVAGIRYAASLVYEQLYNAYQNFRLGVALNGLAYPMQEHLNEPRFRQFQSTNLPDMIGQVAANFASQLPKKEMPLVSNGLSSAIINALFNREKHLIYPPAATVPNTPYGATPGENDPAQGGPRSYFSAAASFYIYGDIPLDPAFIDMLAELEGEEEKHRAYVKEHKGPQLGNALRLSEEIYDRWKTGKKIPDFNLDADRGYAYTCWVQKGDTREELRALEDSPAVKLHFIQP